MVLTLLHLSLELAGLTFWWPTNETDGVCAMKYVHNRLNNHYHTDMVDIAVIYWWASQFFAKFPFARTALDKPGRQRLLELYRCSIPLY